MFANRRCSAFWICCKGVAIGHIWRCIYLQIADEALLDEKKLPNFALLPFWNSHQGYFFKAKKLRQFGDTPCGKFKIEGRESASTWTYKGGSVLTKQTVIDRRGLRFGVGRYYNKGKSDTTTLDLPWPLRRSTIESVARIEWHLRATQRGLLMLFSQSAPFLSGKVINTSLISFSYATVGFA